MMITRLEQKAVQRNYTEYIMNSLAWIGVIAWGIVITVFGISTVGPVSAGSSVAMQAQDVVFLIACGLVTSLIGTVGLAGFMGWIPGLQPAQKSYS